MLNRKPDADDKFRYLGFEINPGEIDDFWQSEDEKKKYMGRVRTRGSQSGLFDRESSLISASLMSSADKIISYIGNAILILAFFLPAYSVEVSGRTLSGSGISYFLNMPLIGGYAAWGGIAMILAVIVYSLILLTCPAAGILNIIGLMNKNRGEKYFATVKKFSRFTFVPILLYVLFLVILIFGGPQPFGSLGSESIGDSLNFTAIFTITGAGFWVNIAGLALAFAQSRGL